MQMQLNLELLQHKPMFCSREAAVNAAQVEVNKLKPLVEKNIISNVQLQTAL